MTLNELAKVALDTEQSVVNPALNKLVGSVIPIAPDEWESAPDSIKAMYRTIALAVARAVLTEAADRCDGLWPISSKHDGAALESSHKCADFIRSLLASLESEAK